MNSELNSLSTCKQAYIMLSMDSKDLSAKELSRRGGLARAKNLSAERLSKIARKAGIASGKARRKLAKEKKRTRT